MRFRFHLAAALGVALTITACGTPTERRAVGEIPPGPGLLTGEKGEIVVRRK
jgi:hypothetical protein